MNAKCLALLGAFLISTGTSASADWVEVGHVSVHDQGERFMRDFAMSVPVEKLRLETDGNEVFCRSVQANFANGNTLEVFEGLLRGERPTDVDFPGNGLGLQSLTFQCGALVRGDVKIDIIADVGARCSSTVRSPTCALHK